MVSLSVGVSYSPLAEIVPAVGASVAQDGSPMFGAGILRRIVAMAGTVYRSWMSSQTIAFFHKAKNSHHEMESHRKSKTIYMKRFPFILLLAFSGVLDREARILSWSLLCTLSPALPPSHQGQLKQILCVYFDQPTMDASAPVHNDSLDGAESQDLHGFSKHALKGLSHSHSPMGDQDESVLFAHHLEYIMREQKLQPIPRQIEVMTSLHQVMQHSMDVIVVGAPASGKSVIISSLALALRLPQPASTELESVSAFVNENIQVHPLCPASVPHSLLFGAMVPKLQPWKRKNTSSEKFTETVEEVHMDPSGLRSLVWQNGIFGSVLSTAANSSTSNDNTMHSSSPSTTPVEPIQHWMVLDGKLELSWVEGLLPLLSRPDTFELESGATIRLQFTAPVRSSQKSFHRTSNVSVLFETEDLDEASPALISRCCVVYVRHGEKPGEEIWRYAVQTWAEKFPHTWSGQVHSSLLTLALHSFEKGLAYVAAMAEQFHAATDGVTMAKTYLSPAVALNTVSSVCNLFNSLTTSAASIVTEGDRGKHMDDLRVLLEKHFVFSFVWGIGASLPKLFFAEFDSFVRELFTSLQWRLPLRTAVMDLVLDGGIMEGDSGLNTHGTFKPWTSVLPQFSKQCQLPSGDWAVPTVDTVPYMYLAQKLAHNNVPVLLVGDAGVGKSVLLHSVVSSGHINRVVDGAGFSAGVLGDEYDSSHGNDAWDGNIREADTDIDHDVSLLSRTAFVNFDCGLDCSAVQAIVSEKLNGLNQLRKDAVNDALGILTSPGGRSDSRVSGPYFDSRIPESSEGRERADSQLSAGSSSSYKPRDNIRVRMNSMCSTPSYTPNGPNFGGVSSDHLGNPSEETPLVLCVDDLHVASVDSCELLRQFVQYAGGYARPSCGGNASWTALPAGSSFLFSMTGRDYHIGGWWLRASAKKYLAGGRQLACGARMLRLLQFLCLPEPTKAGLEAVFVDMLCRQLRVCDSEINAFRPAKESVLYQMLKKIVKATVHIHFKISKCAKPNPVQPQCQFHIRDLARVFRGDHIHFFNLLS